MDNVEPTIPGDGKPVAVYTNNVIKGVGLSINTRGEVSIHPEGYIANAGHKLSKWLKKRF